MQADLLDLVDHSFNHENFDHQRIGLLQRCRFEQISFNELTFDSAEDCQFNRCNFNRTTIRWGLMRCNLGFASGSICFHAYLPTEEDGRKVTEPIAPGGHVRDCDFSHARLNGSIATGLPFTNCDFTSSAWLGGHFKKCVWRNCKMQAIDFSQSDLSQARFVNANLKEAKFNQASLTGTVFKNCNLEAADFSDSDLNGADFSSADLRGATFTNASIKDVNWGELDSSVILPAVEAEDPIDRHHAALESIARIHFWFHQSDRYGWMAIERDSDQVKGEIHYQENGDAMSLNHRGESWHAVLVSLLAAFKGEPFTPHWSTFSSIRKIGFDRDAKADLRPAIAGLLWEASDGNVSESECNKQARRESARQRQRRKKLISHLEVADITQWNQAILNHHEYRQFVGIWEYHFNGLAMQDLVYEGINLSQLLIRDASFLNCTFMYTNFQETDLSGSRFENCRFIHTSFIKSKLNTASFQGCQLQNIQFNDADLENADLRWSHMDKVDLTLANLNRARLPSSSDRQSHYPGTISE